MIPMLKAKFMHMENVCINLIHIKIFFNYISSKSIQDSHHENHMKQNALCVVKENRVFYD